MQPHGNFAKGIMVIGEAPGEVEDDRGLPFQGKTGQLLRRFFKREGIDLFEDCVVLNAVNCRPPKNRDPKSFEIDCCREFIVNPAIEEYKPEVIIILGTIALKSVIGNRWKKDLGGITRWRGWQIPDQDLGCWIVPTFHPSYISRMDDGSADFTWSADLKKAFDLVNQTMPKPKKVDIIYDEIELLDQIKTDLIAIDYETTGLKPYAAGHRIVCAAVAFDENKVLSFMIPPTRRERQPLINLLENREIGMMAHNMKYEDTWSRVKFNAKPVNWEFDSMLAAHILDNRSATTSLKFQTYVNFGIIDYDSEIYPYLVGSDYKNANSFNRVLELAETRQGRSKLTEYCAYDAIYEYRLAQRQINMMNYSFLPF
jgi:uracil-DNA glycosylase family 4